ncbi:MAG TPA: hypothetical protein VHA52_09755, partial [Candidatus Babeliaceae bacterium]|nr:hypothetical protein [Candidatus Babeliaceae bacterium]
IIFISKTLILQNEANFKQTRPRLLKYIVESRAKAAGKKLPKTWMTVVDKEQMVIDGYPLLDFVFKENDLTKIPEPVVLRGKTFYPVTFDNITCGEFEDAEIISNNFFKEPSDKLLASLTSILFRPKKKGIIMPYMTFNFRASSFKVYDHSKVQRRFLKLTPGHLYSIYIWYLGCRKQLTEIFPSVYSGGVEAPSDPLAFTNCIHAGAGPKNGNRSQIRAMKLYEFMYDMEQEAIKAIELKQEYERLRHAR